MKNDKQIVVRVDNELKDAFITRCKAVGFSVSKRLRVLIENDINNGNRI